MRKFKQNRNCFFWFFNFSYNQQTHNQYHNRTYHNSLSMQSTLLHVSTLPCHHQAVYSQSLAKLHTTFKLRLLKTQFYKIIKILKYFLFFFTIKLDKIFSVLPSLVQSVCICGCIYNLQKVWALLYGYINVISCTCWINSMMNLPLCWCYFCAGLACLVGVGVGFCDAGSCICCMY